MYKKKETLIAKEKSKYFKIVVCFAQKTYDKNTKARMSQKALQCAI
jgi:hypothetical protein